METTDVPRGFKLTRELRPGGVVSKIAWSLEGSRLASICGSIVSVWDANSLQSFNIAPQGADTLAIDWSPDGRLAVGLADGRIEIWDPGGKEPLRQLTLHRAPVVSLAWSPNGKVLASGSGIGQRPLAAYRLYCWDTSTWTAKEMQPRHANVVRCLSWSPDSISLVSGSEDFTAKIWDAGKYKLQRELTPKSGGVIYDADWFPCGEVIAIGSHRDVVIWKMGEQYPVQRLKGHTGVVTNISVYKQSPVLIATKSLDGTVRLWDTTEWRELALLVEPTQNRTKLGLQFHPSELRLASLNDGDTAIRIWDLDVDALYGRTPKPLPRSAHPASAELPPESSVTPASEVPARSNSRPEDVYDIAIICALPTPELEKVKMAGGGHISWEERRFSNDPQIYYAAQYLSKKGDTIKVIASYPNQMGMTNTAVLTAKMIYRFLPKCVIMVGIAAGTEGGGRNYGDILAASTSFDYGSGKITIADNTKKRGSSKNSTELFLPDYNPIPIDPTILQKLHAKRASNDYVDEIRNRWPAKKPPTALRLHIGPIGSGAAVINSAKQVENVRQHWRKLIGIEMEIYGVFSAGRETIIPSPYFLAFKSVCDFAENKNDDWQDYAAFTAAEFCYRFIINDLWDEINQK